MSRKQEVVAWFPGATWNRIAQLAVVLLGALALKLSYSTASPNQLRWILAPTTALVEFVSGTRFEFESYEGYMSSDRSFLIAASCAGVNFLIASFLMLSLGRLWRDRSRKRSVNAGWKFIPLAALFAYLTTLVANTVRISTSLRIQRTHLELGWLSGNQLHRFEGIFIYFGFLLLLFLLSERSSGNVLSLERTPRSENVFASRNALASQNALGSRVNARLANVPALLRQSIFPLLIYYATTLGIPLANAAYRPGTVAADFWEHSVFVLLTPLLLILPLVTLRMISHLRSR